MKNKTILKVMFAAALFTVIGVHAQAISGSEIADLALKDVVSQAQSALTTAPIPAGQPVAVLPLGGQEQFSNSARVMLKSALTAAGKNCVEGKDDEILNEIVKEITWDERKEDILDPATVDRFGSLASAKYLLYGWIRRTIGQERYVLVELELHITEIATKRHIWGKMFTKRLYAPTSDPDGRIKVPAQVRDVMRKEFRDSVSKSLKQCTKLSAIKKVVYLPVVADEDQYVEGLVRDVMASSQSFSLVNADVNTRAEARFALRESPGEGDAILYGVLRDLSATLESIEFPETKTYKAQVEIQLWIENGKTREIIWSDTLAADREFKVKLNWWEMAQKWFPWLKPWMLVVGVPLVLLVALLVLVLVIAFIRSTTRVR